MQSVDSFGQNELDILRNIVEEKAESVKELEPKLGRSSHLKDLKGKTDAGCELAKDWITLICTYLKERY